MHRRQKAESQISEDVDAVDSPMTSPVSRRNFLAVAGVGGATVAAVAATGGIPGAGAAVASSVRAQAATTTTAAASSTSGSSSGGGDTDVATAQFAASLEVVALHTYQAALDAASAGKLGPVPPAGAEFVTTALAQHREQLGRWNDILVAVGQPAVVAPDPKLLKTADQGLAQVTDFGGAAKLARTLEEIAAATYLKALPTLTNKSFRQLAASIQIIDAQHVAILNYVLGDYPVPDTFAKSDMAATP